MRTLYLILYIIAAVLFAVAAVTSYGPVGARRDGTVAAPAVTLTRINFIALGLLAWVLVPLIQMADRLND